MNNFNIIDTEELINMSLIGGNDDDSPTPYSSAVCGSIASATAVSVLVTEVGSCWYYC